MGSALFHNVYVNGTDIGFRFPNEQMPAVVTPIAAINRADSSESFDDVWNEIQHSYR